MLGKAHQRSDSKGILAPFNAANRLGVDADQLGKTFLRQVRPQTGIGHVAANDAQEMLVRHPCLWSA